MDSYFKAAVCDLDKLLDEFEKSTDERDCYRTPQNRYDSKHHLLSSVLDCLQHAYPTSKLPEDANNCTSSEKTPLASHIETSEVLLSYLPQNEKSVAGLDLLSTVDSGSLNEIQSSNLGRCSIPVCDLVNDTGNLVHSVAAQEDAQKLKPDDFQCSESLIGFGIACVPVPTCVSSAGCSCVSSTNQSDGNSVIQGSGHPTVKEINHFTLKSDSCAASKFSDPRNDEHSTESVKCGEVFDQHEQNAHLNAPCVPVTSQNSNAYNPKDEKLCEKLPCEPQDESACSGVKRETCETNAIEKGDSKDKRNVASVPSDLPKGPQMQKNPAALPGNCVLPGSSYATGAEVEIKNKKLEENGSSEELHSSKMLSTVSPSCISGEEVQTSLSCLPLPVSICSSLVAMEEKVNPSPENEMAEVISNISTVCAGKSHMDLSSMELIKNTDVHEEEWYMARINESIMEKSMDGEKDDTKHVIDDSDCQQIKDFAYTFLKYEAEPYGFAVESYCSESRSTGMTDFTVEESVIKSDSLISDAELDDFLYGQTLQSNVLKSSDNYSNLMEANANEGNVSNVNNLDFTEVSEEHLRAKLEDVMSIHSHLKVSSGASQLESATKEDVSCIQNMRESGSEALISDIHTEGARPKQLLGLSQGAVGQTQLNSRSDVFERKEAEGSSVTPDASLSRTIIDVGENSDYVLYGGGSSETVGSPAPENTESLKIPAVFSQKQPAWVPDSEAPKCMNCRIKFTFTKRRHHCRACGKVFCIGCCKQKCKLWYLDKEARVCTGCYNYINKAQESKWMLKSCDDPDPSCSSSTDCSSDMPPLEEAKTSDHARVPSCYSLFPASILKQSAVEGQQHRKRKRVWFADGILPNGEIADTVELSSAAEKAQKNSICWALMEYQKNYEMSADPEEDDTLTGVNPEPEEEICIFNRLQELLCPVSPEAENTNSDLLNQTASEASVSPSCYRAICGIENCISNDTSLVPVGGDELPPLLLAVGKNGKDPIVEEHPSCQQVILLLEEGGHNPLTFILSANLLVNVKQITSSSVKCWYFSTNGLHAVHQAEIIILLQCLQGEEMFPVEMFRFFIHIYKDAMKGRFIRHMENITFTEKFLDNKEHGGFLFVSPTFQKIDDQILPDNPFLYGILIHKLEIPWAKVFPIRLLLRLGAEYDTYPTSVLSFRKRKPLFGGIGCTIMDLLLDFKNYQHILHPIDDLFVHVEMGRICIKIPLRKYDEVMKMMDFSDEHVMRIGASFNTEADSHLVCVQNNHGVYKTQAISAAGHPRKVTGVSFVVFNGILKVSSGFSAKASIIEDGLIVQTTEHMMRRLRHALRYKENFKIPCGKVAARNIKEYIDICWVEDEDDTNKRILSPIEENPWKELRG